MSKDTRPEVCIIESLNFMEEDGYKEGEIIARTLRLKEKRAHYTYVRTTEELTAFMKEFGESDYRYLHISCHGNQGQFFTTVDPLSIEEFVEILAPHVRGRRIFLSACLAANSEFAKQLFEKGKCLSILAPAGSIRFDDAAIFWSAFYHLRFKEKPDSMNRKNVIETAKKCAMLVDEKFRFFYQEDDQVHVEKIGWPKK